MRNAIQFLGLVYLSIALVACRVAEEDIIGTWTTSDGGTITFNADRTGITVNSPYFDFACGAINGVPISVVDTFEWWIESEGTRSSLWLDIPNPVIFPTCEPSLMHPIQFNGNNRIRVGPHIPGVLEDNLELSR